MAKAEVESIEVPRTVVENEEVIVLTLSKAEARALAEVTDRVYNTGGTLGELIKPINHALRKLDIKGEWSFPTKLMAWHHADNTLEFAQGSALWATDRAAWLSRFGAGV